MIPFTASESINGVSDGTFVRCGFCNKHVRPKGLRAHQKKVKSCLHKQACVRLRHEGFQEAPSNTGRTFARICHDEFPDFGRVVESTGRNNPNAWFLKPVLAEVASRSQSMDNDEAKLVMRKIIALSKDESDALVVGLTLNNGDSTIVLDELLGGELNAMRLAKLAKTGLQDLANFTMKSLKLNSLLLDKKRTALETVRSAARELRAIGKREEASRLINNYLEVRRTERRLATRKLSPTELKTEVQNSPLSIYWSDFY